LIDNFSQYADFEALGQELFAHVPVSLHAASLSFGPGRVASRSRSWNFKPL
jgi:hypothetical protein